MEFIFIFFGGLIGLGAALLCAGIAQDDYDDIFVGYMIAMVAFWGMLVSGLLFTTLNI